MPGATLQLHYRAQTSQDRFTMSHTTTLNATLATLQACCYLSGWQVCHFHRLVWSLHALSARNGRGTFDYPPLALILPATRTLFADLEIVLARHQAGRL